MNERYTKHLFFVGGGQSDTHGVSAQAVGNKAYNLMRMDRAGLRVPPSLVLGTELCRAYFEAGRCLPDDFRSILSANVRRLESATGRALGSRRRPLLVAVRSGAPVSMPGMLDTILNIGINDETVHGLIRMTGDARLAWDSYRRVLQSFAETVYGCDPKRFDAVLRSRIAAGDGASLDDLDTSALRDMVTLMVEEFRQACRAPFPQDPLDQLTMAVEAIFNSWQSRRAVDYRRLHEIADDIGTAVTVQAMVFGNRGGRSGSGVGFTRNPATGAAEPYADFLFNAQGEDIVAGRHILHGTADLDLLLPTACNELRKVQTILESEFADMQDFEFTIEDGVLYLLQTRSGKRTPWAGVRIAVELAEAGVIDAATALERLGDYDLGRIERQRLVVKPGQEPVALATPASIGFAAGRIALCPARARELAAAGEPVILVRETTSTEDIAAIAVAAGILTAAGGRTSHAAVVAREMGTVCLVGCRELNIDAANRVCNIGTSRLQEKDYLSLDADCGRVYSGRLEHTCERPTEALARIEQWRRELKSKSAAV